MTLRKMTLPVACSWRHTKCTKMRCLKNKNIIFVIRSFLPKQTAEGLSWLDWFSTLAFKILMASFPNNGKTSTMLLLSFHKFHKLHTCGMATWKWHVKKKFSFTCLCSSVSLRAKWRALPCRSGLLRRDFGIIKWPQPPIAKSWWVQRTKGLLCCCIVQGSSAVQISSPGAGKKMEMVSFTKLGTAITSTFILQEYFISRLLLGESSLRQTLLVFYSALKAGLSASLQVKGHKILFPFLLFFRSNPATILFT